LETIFFWVKILKFFDADPGWKIVGSGIWDRKNLDPEWKNFGSGRRDGKNLDPGSVINFPDPQHCLLLYNMQTNIQYRYDIW
jgi:hypothetical protein